MNARCIISMYGGGGDTTRSCSSGTCHRLNTEGMWSVCYNVSGRASPNRES